MNKIPSPYLSAYTPSNMSAETLEALFVQRHKLLEQSVHWLEESLLTDKKNHLLFVGPRGCGKTHLISMMINRLKTNNHVDDLVVICLGEDDVVTNLTSLALSILNQMVADYPQRFNRDCLAIAKGKSSEEVADIILENIRQQCGETTLLLVKENMDTVFAGLKDLGQKRLRAYLQENNHICLLGSSQQLFTGVSSRDAAFWGFFDIYHLEALSVDEATQLLSRIARLNGDEALVEFLNTAQGEHRVQALHYLVGGNHRLYMELADFLDQAALDDFVTVISRFVDRLTPYFQARIRSLSPQQAAIVQKLCQFDGATQVKIIAESLFIDERAVSSQLKVLKKMNYVTAHKRGRASYYEIAEPLLILSQKARNNHGKPLKIITALLREWFSDGGLSDEAAVDLSSTAKRGNHRWQTAIETLLSQHTANNSLAQLAAVLIATIRVFVEDETLASSFKKWATLWQTASKNHPEMLPAIAATNAAVEALSTGDDRPLLRLPKTIRELICPMFVSVW